MDLNHNFLEANSSLPGDYKFTKSWRDMSWNFIQFQPMIIDQTHPSLLKHSICILKKPGPMRPPYHQTTQNIVLLVSDIVQSAICFFNDSTNIQHCRTFMWTIHNLHEDQDKFKWLSLWNFWKRLFCHKELSNYF